MVLSVAMTATYAGVPQFKDYPSKVYVGPTAKLDVSSEYARDFKTKFNQALKQKPNFAGEYVIATWGCGAGCQSFNFVNKRTGKVLDNEFGGQEEGEMVSEHKASSNLLVTTEDSYDSEYNFLGKSTNFYVLKGDKFQLIKSIKAKN